MSPSIHGEDLGRTPLHITAILKSFDSCSNRILLSGLLSGIRSTEPGKLNDGDQHSRA